MKEFGGRCAVVENGVRCVKLDVSLGGPESLQAHHGKRGKPDLLLCAVHHRMLDPHARPGRRS